MRETLRSLRIYLIISGSLSVVIYGMTLASGRFPVSVTAVSLVGTFAAAGLLYAGLRLPYLLSERPGQALVIVHLNMGFISLLLALSFAEFGLAPSFGHLLVGLAVLVYIRFNMKRLARETSAHAETAVA